MISIKSKDKLTGFDWLEEFSQDLRTKICNNIKNQYGAFSKLHEYYDSKSEFLKKAFNWLNALEGPLFWLDLYCRTVMEEKKTKEPIPKEKENINTLFDFEDE